MKKTFLVIMTLFLGLALALNFPAQAADVEDLHKRIERLEKKSEEEKKVGPLGAMADKITFSGAIELDFSYNDSRDISDKDSDSSSVLDIGTVQLGAEIKFHEWVTGKVILKGENLVDDDKVFWDEAAITIGKDGFPAYFIGGKRAQPFGLFRSHLISDPITKDCYEVAATGATAGFIPGFLGLDLSVTAYKGEILGNKVHEAGYGWVRDPYPNPDPQAHVDSYIFNVSAAPIEGLRLSAYFDSEPGQGDRNSTAGGTVEYQIGPLTFDAEYIAAIKRERNATDSKEYKESAWVAAVAFQVVDPLEIAFRYEGFDDGMTGDQDGHVKNRFSMGANYRLFEKENFHMTLMVEYRWSDFEKTAGSSYRDKTDEFFARLAFAF